MKGGQDAAAQLGLTLITLPAYSPDLNLTENLWRWMPEGAARNCCHDSMRHLFDACKAFMERINAHPNQIKARLWP